MDWTWNLEILKADTLGEHPPTGSGLQKPHFSGRTPPPRSFMDLGVAAPAWPAQGPGPNLARQPTKAPDSGQRWVCELWQLPVGENLYLTAATKKAFTSSPGA